MWRTNVQASDPRCKPHEILDRGVLGTTLLRQHAQLEYAGTLNTYAELMLAHTAEWALAWVQRYSGWSWEGKPLHRPSLCIARSSHEVQSK